MTDPKPSNGGALEEAPHKAPLKDPKKKKDEKKEEDLSDEDLELKAQLELYVERVQDSDPGLRKVALDSMRQEIRTSTSSMTSVPKPLKFLRPHYGTLKSFYETMEDADQKLSLADILSVLALTMSAEGERESLKFRLLGSKGDIGSWGHEYVRNLAGEISQEYAQRQVDHQFIICDVHYCDMLFKRSQTDHGRSIVRSAFLKENIVRPPIKKVFQRARSRNGRERVHPEKVSEAENGRELGIEIMSIKLEKGMEEEKRITKKKKIGKELKNLLGEASKDPMVLEQSISNSGVAERIISRRRKSLADRIAKSKAARKGKKKLESAVIVLDSEEDNTLSENPFISVSTDNDEMEDEVLVQETQEIIVERQKQEKEAWLKKNREYQAITVDHVVDLGRRTGLVSPAVANRAAIRQSIQELLEDAKKEGLEVEDEEEERARMEAGSDGKFDWATETSSEGGSWDEDSEGEGNPNGDE